MKQLNEKHTWFNLDKDECCILQYTNKDASMLTNEVIGKILKGSSNKVIKHKYGVVVFKEPLTSIGEYAFKGCSGLTSVTIPNSVESIEKSAFRGCSGLTSITIPNSVTSIGYNAFIECSGLASVTIPNSVTSIGGLAFWHCDDLTFVTIGNSVESIGKETFGWCFKLTYITIGSGITRIEDNAFNGCIALTDITYKGTKAEFKKIKMGDNVFFNNCMKIHCTDGDVTI